jgi:hypothetical protein
MLRGGKSFALRGTSTREFRPIMLNGVPQIERWDRAVINVGLESRELRSRQWIGQRGDPSGPEQLRRLPLIF